jgi:hypothetical protein
MPVAHHLLGANMMSLAVIAVLLWVRPETNEG